MMKKFIEEFKEFAIKGNVLDMAIGVVIGGAFTAIVTSLVTDIITPLISLITNTQNLEKLTYPLRPAIIENGVVIKEATVLRYGLFLDAIISFLLIAFVIFVSIKALNKVLRNNAPAEEEAVEVIPEKSDELKMLELIYEELKKRD